MRLAIINPACIMRDALGVLGLPTTDVNPTLVGYQSIDDKTCKVFSAQDPEDGILLEKIDLAHLFRGIPQSIKGLSFAPSDVVDLTAYEQEVNVDLLLNAPKLDNQNYETVPDSDYLGQLFCNWKRLVGITTLFRNEVSLSVLDNVLLIEATTSALFTGSLSVQI